MAQAKYVGETEGDIEAFGFVFPEGKAIDVDAKTAAKMQGNPFFKVTGADVDHSPVASGELVVALEAEIAKVAALTSELDAAKAEIEALKKPVATTGLKAEHHGGSKFKITRGEELVAEGLSKKDADAFNDLTPDEQAAYVSDLTK
jgi:hypothetical protein